jgi:outer membrane murein-binding lipoprotein Lpp
MMSLCYNRCMNKTLIAVIVSVTMSGGCASPMAPTDCLSPELEATYDKLEGVRAGDPDYAEAVRWSAICPGWGLLK